MEKCKQKMKQQWMSRNWIYSWQWSFSKIHLAVLSLGELCEDHGYSYEWTSGQKPQLIKNGRRIQYSTENYVAIFVLGSSTGSSRSATPTSPASLPQEAVIPTLRPASTQSECMSSQAWRDRRQNQQKPKTHIKMRTTKQYGETRCVTCQNGYKHSQTILWTEEFQRARTHPRVLLVKQLQSREEKWCRGKHSIYDHFPKDWNCDICKRTTITRAPCRKRTGAAMPRAENFGDMITADHKVLTEGCESRNNHGYAVVVQDLATQWIQSYPCKAKTS